MDASIVCRLCLKFQDTVRVFVVLNGNKPLEELIVQLLQIEINPNINGEYYVCYDCHCVLKNFNEFKTTCHKNDIEFRSRYQLSQEIKQEPEWQIDIEDSVIQPEIHSNVQPLQEQTTISLQIINDNNLESDSISKDVDIIKTQNSDKPKKSRWSERERQRIPCHICGKLVYRACYKAHVTLHDVNIQRFQCEICKRSYKEKHNLTKHLKTHSKKVLFHCKEENCGKAFSSSSTLRCHYKVKHTNIRDHICKVCGRAFALSSDLSGHMRTHSTEKKHACPECGTLFKAPKQLKVHLKIHTRNNPHFCPECNEPFPNASMLNDHRSDTHNVPLKS